MVPAFLPSKLNRVRINQFLPCLGWSFNTAVGLILTHHDGSRLEQSKIEGALPKHSASLICLSRWCDRIAFNPIKASGVGVLYFCASDVKAGQKAAVKRISPRATDLNFQTSV